MVVQLGRGEPQVRFRFWRNRIVVVDRTMTKTEAGTAVDVGEGMLQPGDRWLMVMEDPTGETRPWFYGNDTPFGQTIARGDYGQKLPEGELSIQRNHGVRIPPETYLPTVFDEQ